MKFRKTLEKIIGTALIGGALFFGSPKKIDADPVIYLSAGTDIDMYFNNFSSPITVPDDLRTVPIHTDDASPDDSGPILIPNIDKWYPHSIGARLGVGLTENILDLKLGFDVKKIFFDYNMNERNYTNHPGTDIRGFGAALVYYKLKYDTFLPGAFARLSCKFLDIPLGDLKKNIQSNLFVDYSANLYSVNLETGWDRYDALEVKNNFKIADLLDQNIRAGIDLGVSVNPNSKDVLEVRTKILELFAGLNITNILGANYPGISTSNPCFTFGMNLSASFDVINRK